MQELTDASNTAGGTGESTDRADESVSQGQSTNEEAAVKMEPAEVKQEVAAAPPARRASTSTPSNLPVRLLTRLGSLDGEFTGEKRQLRWFPSLLNCDAFAPRCSSSAG